VRGVSSYANGQPIEDLVRAELDNPPTLISHKYSNNSMREPSEIKLGNRKWVDVTSAKKKAACGDAAVEIQSSNNDRRLLDILPNESLSADNNVSQITLNRKYGEDDQVTQQEIDDLNAMINAMYYDDEFAAGAVERCRDLCNDAATAASFLCLAVGFFGTPVAGGACELSIGVNWALCRIGCSSGRR
jgi:hypothetical protein